MKLLLVNKDGEVLAKWSIGGKPEFDVEDLKANPEHDFYLENNYDDYRSVGESIWGNMWFYYDRGER